MQIQTVPEKQQQRAERARTERSNYHLALGEIKVTEKATGRVHRVRRVIVRKLSSSASYSVVFPDQGAPRCCCPDSLRHRGTAVTCKHAAMALEFIQPEF